MKASIFSFDLSDSRDFRKLFYDIRDMSRIVNDDQYGIVTGKTAEYALDADRVDRLAGGIGTSESVLRTIRLPEEEMELTVLLKIL